MSKNIPVSRIFVYILVALLFPILLINLFFWLNLDSDERQTFLDYQLNYQKYYSKIQTPESLFNVFVEKIGQKDLAALEKITCPAFGSFTEELRKDGLADFVQVNSLYDYSQNEAEIGFDSGNYFLIKSALQNRKKVERKLYFSEVHLTYKGNSFQRLSRIFPLKNYYCLNYGSKNY